MFKIFSCVNILFLLLQSSFLMPFLEDLTKEALANDMCSVDVDVVLIMDRSGSMADGEALSKCEWPEKKQYGGSSTWFLNTKYDVTEDWCNNVRDSFDESEPVFRYIPLKYIPSSNSKMDNAKNAAKLFLDNFQANDQSALVSFANDATLDKLLDNNHSNTKTEIDSLTPFESTNIGDAILEGMNELNSERANPKANHVMILLTDGKANKPNGDGYNENALDVQYALDKAQEAANQGYKIFTVGLGSNSDINETMLQDIASLAEANYHHVPNGEDLTDIYNEIAWEVCQYGSISGCKFEDENKNNIIDTGEETLEGWEIILEGGQNGPLSQETDQDGCYTFAGLSDGIYTVSEGDNLDKGDFTQTYPQNLIYENVEILDHNDISDINFANYLPKCGNNILDAGEECDQSNDRNCTTTSGYAGLQSCDNCSWGECITEEFCGDGIVNGPEECDDGNNEDDDGCSSICEIEQSAEPVCGNGIKEGSEECDEGENNGNHTLCSENCTLNPECNDGIDNDQDGLIDFSDDPGCASLIDDNETDEEEPEGIQPGDIIINEVMQNPSAALSDYFGEWFELYNATNNALDLNGCIISDNDTNSHEIDNSLIIPSQGYLVLAINGDTAWNGGITPDYIYSGFYLSNTDDEIILECDGKEIDRIEYDDGATFPDPSGKSMIFNPSLLGSNAATLNDDGNNWCESTSSYGNGDLGTPGAANDPCEGGIECFASESSRECIDDGYASVYYIYNQPGCPDNYYETVEDSDCDCILTETEGECSSDGYREYSYTYNYSYCGQNHTQEIADSDCECEQVDETPGNCISETHRLWNLIYNYNYCEPQTEEREDSNCASEPICGNGILEEGEECDDGNNEDGDGCSSICENEGPPAPTASIEGCKYLDSDKDGEISDETETLAGWEITLHNGNVPLTATTDENGCYKFENLYADSYTVEEDVNVDKQPYTQTYPANLSHTITLNEGQSKVDVDFGNYLPVCGNGILDSDYGEECDDGNLSDEDGCSSACQIEIPEDDNECSISGYKFEDADKDHLLDEGENKLGGWEILLFKNNTSTVLKSQTTNEDGYYLFDHLEPGDYYVKEGTNDIFEPFLQTYPTTTFHTLNLVYTENEEDINFGNYLPVCGNGILDTMKGAEEECDDGNTTDGDGCSRNCRWEKTSNGSGGGGGGSVYIPLEEESQQEEVLSIFNETDSLTGDTINIMWETNLESDSKVIYSKEGEGHTLDESNEPNYGYAHSYNNSAEEEVIFHTVKIPWLEPCTTYYYRDVSSLSTGETAFSPERSFKTACEEEEEEEEIETSTTTGTGGPIQEETETEETKDTEEITEPETEEEIIEATSTEEIVEGTTTATTTPSNFLANLTNLLKDFTNKCFTCFPWWTILIFALLPLYKCLTGLKEKEDRYPIFWFIWTFIHLLIAAIIFFSFSLCVPLWLFILLVLGDIILWQNNYAHKKNTQEITLFALAILLSLSIVLLILHCLYIWLIILGIVGFIIFVLSFRTNQASKQENLPI